MSLKIVRDIFNIEPITCTVTEHCFHTFNKRRVSSASGLHDDGYLVVLPLAGTSTGPYETMSSSS